MNAQSMQSMVAGFDSEAFGSQAVFRVALQALSHPGQILNMPMDAQWPQSGHGAAALLLLGLLDADTTLWMSESLAQSDATAWLRFHTGCLCVSDPHEAQFLWLAQGQYQGNGQGQDPNWPSLAQLRQGSDAYPDQSATCVIEVQSLQAGASGWVLQGPGIATQQTLQVQGLAADFQAQWADNHGRFPQGVDVFLTTPTQVVGLPRTTRILNSQEA
ncbi:phosphonate C-P lyase system protein PhnH [Limnohabitans sp. Rim8]|jgi:alpha-D-ribose 1-methylphosphonate 5-triphosphate synthase subunit PhnH|uniref:phosphonate C-P lyase system protein PhnH n=1 Tax=Limnohabitans sp. Rim8 TaxID=1100718 RepID=UPI0025CFFC66|nr:phosphonate C-P lyase system protein PhnH [Limnohabitans sp. Rim8]